MIKFYLITAANLTEGFACDSAQTHGFAAKTIIGVSDDIARKLAAKMFEGVFTMAALANLCNLINNIFIAEKTDKLSLFLDTVQMGTNVTQAVYGVDATVLKASRVGGWLALGAQIASFATDAARFGLFLVKSGVLSCTAQKEAIRSSDLVEEDPSNPTEETHLVMNKRS